MSGTVNVGVIGAGSFIGRQHLPNMAINPNIRIHTICDLDADLLARRAEEYGPVRCTTDSDEVLSSSDIHAVLVGTRSKRHAEFLVKAAQAGKHVYVEKPMTMSYEETSRVLDAVRGTGIIVGIGFNRRFAPIMAEAKRMFHEYRDGPGNIIYRIVDDHRIRPRYIFDMNDGGGHLLQESCHIFDLLAWFLEEEPVEIYAAGPLETDNIAVIKFADGSLATILCGGKGGFFYPKELMEIFCANRTLAVDQFYELRFDGYPRSLRKTFPLDKKTRLVPEEDSMTGFYETSFGARPERDVICRPEGEPLRLIGVDKGHDGAMRAFVDAITSSATYPLGAIDGARATVCALKAYESIRANRPVAVSPEEYGLGSG